jgi:MscS family membrane protein
MNPLSIDLIHQQLFGIPLVVYLRVVIIMVCALVLRKYIAAIVAKIFFTVFKRIADKAHTQKFKDLLHRPIECLLLTVLFFIALNQFNIAFEKIMLFERHKVNPNQKTETLVSSSFSLMELVDHVFFFSFIFYSIFLLVRIISFLFYIWVERAVVAGDRERQQLLPLLRDVFVVMLWGFGFFTVLGVVFHVNVPTLIAGLGFGGVAVAFAAKESLENLLASFMIMVDKPFTIGDHIRIGNVEGKAEKIGFRSTRIRTFDKTLISLPNKNLIGDSLENFSERGMARVKLKINASYGLSQATIKTIIDEIRKFINSDEHTSDDAHAYLENFGGSLEIAVSYYIKVPSPVPLEDVKQKINFGIYQIMYQYGKGFGVPTSITLTSEGINEVEAYS